MTDTDEKIAALKEATRAANEALGDLKRTVKEGRDFLAKSIEEEADKIVQKHTTEGLEAFTEAVIAAKTEATKKIFKEFDDLHAMLMGTTKTHQRQGAPSIPEMIEKRATIKNDIGDMPF